MKFSKALRLTLVFAIIGFVVSFLVFFVQRNIFSAAGYYRHYVRLPDVAGGYATDAYQRFQLFQSGSSVDFQKEILDPITSAQQWLQNAYDGRENVRIRF